MIRSTREGPGVSRTLGEPLPRRPKVLHDTRSHGAGAFGEPVSGRTAASHEMLALLYQWRARGEL